MCSSDLDILQRLTAVEEGKITPVGVKHGLNKQQKGVPQLPALFKPRKISVLGGGQDPEHPMQGMAVGANESRLAEAMAEIEEDMLSKVKKNLTHYLDQLEKETYDDGQRNKDATPDLDRLSKKERQYRDMIEKAVSAIDAAEAVEEDDVDGRRGLPGEIEQAGRQHHAGGAEAEDHRQFAHDQGAVFQHALDDERRQQRDHHDPAPQAERRRRGRDHDGGAVRRHAARPA